MIDEERRDLVTEEEAELEDQVLNAIMGDGTFTLNVKVGSRELSLNFRWPDMRDEQLIERLTVNYNNGFPVESLTDAGFEMARGRAVIEVLAEGPFEDAPWLPAGDEKVMHRGKKVLRPDTGKVKSRAVLVAFARKYYETYARFQELSLG